MLTKQFKHKELEKIIHFWLFWVLSAALLVTLAGFLVVQAFYLRKYSFALVSDHVVDVDKSIIESREDSMKEYLHSLKIYLEKNPGNISDAFLAYFVETNDIGLSEVNISDERGIIRHSSNLNNLGYDMHNGNASAEFLCLLEPDNEYYFQRLRENSLDHTQRMYYAGVAFSDNSGFIQIGRSEELYYELLYDKVDEIARDRRIGINGLVVICDKSGRIIGSTRDMYEERDLAHKEILPQIDGEIITADLRLLGQNYYVAALATEDYYVIGGYPKVEAKHLVRLNTVMVIFLNIAVNILIFVILTSLLRHYVVGGIKQINASLERITGGDLSERVRADQSVEFEKLSDGINTMVDRLIKMIAQAKAKMEEELENAKIIQTSSLPSVFPPFPDRRDFDIYASMNAARMVGGDFYDFFMVGSDHLAIVMADVSDKGIPAAMLMMRTQSQIRSRAKKGGTPAQILRDVNEVLCKNNESFMFVTVWLTIIDLSTGQGMESNAGHEHPVFYTNGRYRLIKYPHSLPIGILSGESYTNREYVLSPGDAIFVYTDGVTDAADRDGAQFGEDRLEEVLNACRNGDSKDTLLAVKSAIDDHVKEAPQFDDITMCSFRYLGGELYSDSSH